VINIKGHSYRLKEQAFGKQMIMNQGGETMSS